ncbi:MAG: hypothetical protein ACR2G0_12385 [Chthoniobacterales bacterium]
MKSLSLQFENQRDSRKGNAFSGGRRPFPLINQHYQATVEEPARAATLAPEVDAATQAAEVRSFRQLSREAVGSKSRWSFSLEATVLALIVATVAWPLLSFLTLISVNPFPW